MKVQLQRIWASPSRGPILSGIAGVGGGAIAGYILSRYHYMKALKHEIDQFEAELKNLREEYWDRRFGGDKQPDHIIVDEQIVVEGRKVEEEPPGVIRTRIFADNDERIFADNDDEWDYEEEKKLRNSSEPYVLNQDEYFSSEMGFEQGTYTWYEGDDTLVNEQNPTVPIYNHHQMLGENLDKFGHGSGAAHVVYIRNESRREEYEVLHDSALFTLKVMGMEMDDGQSDEISHAHRSVPKFRQE